jgi:ubiquinone/menaquinone biosynthesis C-methylase UbiE
VLDVGCGTGTLVVMLKTRHPDVDVVGLDPDQRCFARDTRHAGESPFNSIADSRTCSRMRMARSIAFSSFMFHHLEPGEKEKTVREVSLLKPSATFHLLDFSQARPPSDILALASRPSPAAGQLRRADPRVAESGRIRGREEAAQEAVVLRAHRLLPGHALARNGAPSPPPPEAGVRKFSPLRGEGSEVPSPSERERVG